MPLGDGIGGFWAGLNKKQFGGGAGRMVGQPDLRGGQQQGQPLQWGQTSTSGPLGITPQVRQSFGGPEMPGPQPMQQGQISQPGGAVPGSPEWRNQALQSIQGIGQGLQGGLGIQGIDPRQLLQRMGMGGGFNPFQSPRPLSQGGPSPFMPNPSGRQY